MSVLLAIFNIICCTFVVLVMCLFTAASIKCFFGASSIKDIIFFLLFAVFTSWVMFLIQVYIMKPAWFTVFQFLGL